MIDFKKLEPFLLVLMLVVGFVLGYAINAQLLIDNAYNTCAQECNLMLENISGYGPRMSYKYNITQEVLANLTQNHG